MKSVVAHHCSALTLVGVASAVALVWGCGRIRFDPLDGPSEDAGRELDAGASEDAAALAPCGPSAARGLVACYPFDGDAMDHGESGVHPTVSGETYESGVTGQAIRFDRATSFLIPDDPRLDTSELTIELWLRPDGFSASDQQLVDRDPQYELELTSTARLRARCTIGGRAETIESIGRIPRDAWTHVAMVYSGGTVRLYLDGVEDTAAVFSGALGAAGRGGIWVGRDHADATEGLSGLMDELRFFDVPRTPAEICAAAGRPAADAGAVCRSDPPAG